MKHCGSIASCIGAYIAGQHVIILLFQDNKHTYVCCCITRNIDVLLMLVNRILTATGHLMDLQLGYAESCIDS